MFINVTPSKIHSVQTHANCDVTLPDYMLHIHNTSYKFSKNHAAVQKTQTHPMANNIAFLQDVQIQMKRS